MDINNVLDHRVKVLLNYISEDDSSMSVRAFLVLVSDRITSDLTTNDPMLNKYLEDRI